MNQESPVKIGTEVEMPFPTSWPNDRVEAAAREFGKKKGWPSSIAPSTILGSHDYEQYAKADPSERIFGIIRHWSTHPWETMWPENFRSPDGWERGWESAHEFRFYGPAETIRETFRRYDTLQVYLDSWGNRPQTGYGTHIHMGVKEWLHDKFDNPNSMKWFTTPIARLVYGYLTERLGGIKEIVSRHRGVQYAFGSSPIYEIHNRWVANQSDSESIHSTNWVQGGRKSLPTFEARMFAATTKMDAVKGYTALLISLLKRAESLMTPELIKAAANYLNAGDKCPLTAAFYGPGGMYTSEHMKDEVRETGFWTAPLLSWIDETIKNNGEPTPFEGSLYEIYDIIPDTGEKVTNFELPARNSAGKRQAFEAASPLAAAA